MAINAAESKERPLFEAVSFLLPQITLLAELNVTVSLKPLEALCSAVGHALVG